MNLINEYLNDTVFDAENVVLADGLDDAFVGVGNAFGGTTCAVYDKDKVIEILMTRDGMTHDEAWEFFDFNIAGAYVGEATPIFVRLMHRPTGQFKDTQTSSSSAVLTQTKPKTKRRKHAVKNKA